MATTYHYSIGYAYATSPFAEQLGFGKTGCYYLQGKRQLEDGSWTPPYIVPGSEGEACEKCERYLLDLEDEYKYGRRSEIG